jgi:hypothetical protein
MVLPVLALIGVLSIAYAVLRWAASNRPVLRGAVPLLVIAVAMGFSIPNVARILASPIDAVEVSGPDVPGEGIAVATWLRDHSDPADLVATNLHCRQSTEAPAVCDARQFWISGYSERHVLVEGWAYTPNALASAREAGVGYAVAPFWDPPLLALNDRAFSHPSPAVLAELRDGYGVRWLFADLTHVDMAALGGEADLRYRDGDYAVYEVRRP